MAGLGCALLLGGLVACAGADVYSVSGIRISKNGTPWTGGGVNAFDQFGFSDKTGWGVQVVREVVDDLSECPIDSASGSLSTAIGYLHPLEDVVARNRAQGLITILCPFGWDTGNYKEIRNSIPSAMPWYAQFKTRLGAVAKKFAGNSDVWLEVWNEPYAWDNTGFTESQWLSDMNDLYQTVRAAGNTNLLLIPGQANDGQETVLLHQGAFLAGKTNVVATIHCYNGWTGYSQSSSEQRIQSIHAAGWALVFGEVGQDAWVADCSRLLNASVSHQVPPLAWSWGASDGSGLVANGAATDWGKQFFPYLPKYGALSPTLAGIANQTILAGRTLCFTNSATGPNVPPLQLTYSLVGAPNGATINPTNGVFSWRPGIAQSPATNVIGVVVTDSGTPSLAATQNFIVVVQAPARPTLQQAVFNNGVFQAWISGSAGPDYSVLASTNLIDWQPILVANAPAMPLFFMDRSAGGRTRRFYQVRMGP